MTLYIADMEQFADLIDALRERADAIADVVARDMAAAGANPPEPLRAARGAVDWLLTELQAGDRVRPASLEALREEGRAAAAAGRPVAWALDPYLTAGWAIWEATGELPDAGPSLPELGGILLRAGDAAAAAIAAAFADAEASLAARTASARREFLDELLGARPGDPSIARLARRAPAHGLAPGVAVRVVLVAAARDLGDDDAAVGRLTAELGPRAAIVATDGGRALALVRSGRLGDAGLRAALDASLGPNEWTAVVGKVDEGLPGIGQAVATAHAALRIAVRLGRRGTLESPGATLLEQALLADEALLERAVTAVLAPLATTPRTGGELVTTLRIFLETAGNRRETARRLGLAPRTVAYRLRRIEVRLGTRLAGANLLRLATVLFASGLLGSGGETAAEPGGQSGGQPGAAGPGRSPAITRRRDPARR